MTRAGLGGRARAARGKRGSGGEGQSDARWSLALGHGSGSAVSPSQGHTAARIICASYCHNFGSLHALSAYSPFA